MDPNQSKAVKKSFIKLMPIWAHLEKFNADYTAFLAEANPYLDRLEDRLIRFGNLPALNLTNNPKKPIPNPADNDSDIVLVYQKNNGNYTRQEDTPEIPTHKFKRSDGNLKTDSLKLLGKKIECNEQVYAMDHVKKPWVKCTVDCVYRKPELDSQREPLVIFRLKLGEGENSRTIRVNKYAIARIQEHGDRLRVAKRVIAGFTHSNLMSGIIGYEPIESNGNRYLVHMDDGSCSYFKPNQVYPILAQSARPWLDSRNLGIKHEESEACRRFYFAHYPKRHILKVETNDRIDLLRNGVVVSAKVLQKDCDVLRILYKDGSEESIYRGSLRLMKNTPQMKLQLSTLTSIDHFYDPLLYNTHLYHKATKSALEDDVYECMAGMKKTLVLARSNQQTARKSTASKPGPIRKRVNFDGEDILDCVTPEDWDPKRAEELKRHKCNPTCTEIPGIKTEVSVRDIIGEFRHVSDLKVPLLLGWKRKVYKMAPAARGTSHKFLIGYEAPCGKIFDRVHVLRNALFKMNSKLDIDYFSFELDVRLDRHNGDFYPIYYKENFAVDSKTGYPLENKHISLFNQFNEEELPGDFEYRNESFPHPMLKAKGFSFNREFKSSCDCEDNCSSRASCACHQLNEDSFGRRSYARGQYNKKCQYNDKRLHDQVSTGIFECNSNCKCSSKCCNRVVQNGIRFRLQVQKTLNKGWGVITLDDIPRGAFICTYSAEVLDDADQYGDSDMYYADLDFITVNETAKLGHSDEEKSDEGKGDSASESGEENWTPKVLRKDKKQIVESDNEDDNNVKGKAPSTSSISSLEQDVDIIDLQSEDDKQQPKSPQRSRYPKRKINQSKPAQSCSINNVRGRGAKQRGDFRSIHDILGSHDFTLDARMQGNVGRFFNHSCDPNATVQNVFIETHDLRFPVVAFFASKNIKALDEITWNYNYKMGCIEGRRIDCHCGAPNCRGRIL